MEANRFDSAAWVDRGLLLAGFPYDPTTVNIPDIKASYELGRAAKSRSSKAVSHQQAHETRWELGST
jgi:hypothetical protein